MYTSFGCRLVRLLEHKCHRLSSVPEHWQHCIPSAMKTRYMPDKLLPIMLYFISFLDLSKILVLSSCLLFPSILLPIRIGFSIIIFPLCAASAHQSYWTSCRCTIMQNGMNIDRRRQQTSHWCGRLCVVSIMPVSFEANDNAIGETNGSSGSHIHDNTLSCLPLNASGAVVHRMLAIIFQ